MDRVDGKFARTVAQPMDRANRTWRARCECRLRRRERLSGRGRATDAGAYIRRREDLDEYYRRPSGERPGGSNPRRSGKSETALCRHAFRRVRLFRPGGALGPGWRFAAGEGGRLADYSEHFRRGNRDAWATHLSAR